VLREGWRERLVPVRNPNTRGCTGWCLEVHDLAASKLAAGREKDLDFVAGLLKHGMAKPASLLQRIATLPLDDARRAQLRSITQRLAGTR
jgi:hypothetical protein